MKGHIIQIVLGAIAAACGIYVRVSLWDEMPEDLGTTIYFMICFGLLIVLLNVRWMINNRKGVVMPKPENVIIPILCPSCQSKKGLRLVPEGETLRVICKDCEQVDEDLDPNAIFDTLMAIMQYSSDNEGLTHEQLTDLVYEKFNLPEFEDDDEAE